MDIQTAKVQIPSLDIVIDAYRAEPLQSGTFPAILVFQEVFGVNAHIRQVTDRFAQAGYVAIAPNLYQRTAPGFDVGYSDTDLTLGRYHKDLTTAAQILADTQATITYLRRLSSVDGKHLGCIGFCFGGHMAYLAATLPEMQATASFYGAGIPVFTPGGGEPSLSHTAEIQGRMALFWGTQDPLIPTSQADAVETALQQHQVDYRAFRYPASHGFFCDQRASFNPAAAQAAWVETLNFFEHAFQNE